MLLRPSAARKIQGAKRPVVLVAFATFVSNLLFVGGCGPKRRPEGVRLVPPPPELAAVLLPPEKAQSEKSLGTARLLHQDLLRGVDPALILRQAVERLAQSGDSVFSLVTAQAALVRGQPRECLDRLKAQAPEEAPAWKLLEARCLEGVGAWIEAAEAYRQLRNLPAGEAGFVRVGTQASKLLEARAEDSLRNGDLEGAERAIRQLRDLRRNHLRTLQLELELMQRRGDSSRELALLRAWPPSEKLPRDLELRWADLELDLGQPSQGLEIYRRLLQQEPSNPDLIAALPWAELRWRLANAPREVRTLLEKPRWTRADLARFLYWGFARVRSELVQTGKIAVDILDHPAREELIRILNLELIPIDPVLRTFEPFRPAKKVDLLRALARLVRRVGQGTCRVNGEGRDQESPCVVAVRCGWVPTLEACGPDESLGGSSAAEILRRAVATLEGR